LAKLMGNRLGQQQKMRCNRYFLNFSKQLDTGTDADIGDHSVSGIEAKRMCISVFAPKIPN